MTTVISVRFRNGCKTYYFDPRDLTVKTGTDVIVETAQGPEFAQCVAGNHEVEDSAVVEPLRTVIRIATENDRHTVAYNRSREKDAFDICQKKIVQHGLEMKLVRAECSFDGSKFLFFFTADGRVDFRELVKDLAGVFHSRIELRQIGVRDEAKMLGGLGICGRPFCCSAYLDDFLPVSIKMAKTQSLSLNPTKISGTCGRLMCCLNYEQASYESAINRLPRPDSFVLTPDGPGNVADVNLLKETITVHLDSRPEDSVTYHNEEILLLRSGKGSRDGIVIPDKRPERYVVRSEAEAASPAPVSRWEENDITSETVEDSRRQGRSRRRRGNPNRTPAEHSEKAVQDADRDPVPPAAAKQSAPSAESANTKKKPRHRSGRRHNRHESNHSGNES